MNDPACRFFGGPFHDTIFEIADDVLTVDLAEVIEESDNLPAISSEGIVRYSRVHEGRTPTLQFEYIGKVK